MSSELNQKILSKDVRSLARVISMVENEVEGYEDLMKSLSTGNRNNIIGITGPPGAGKSTLTDGLIKTFVEQDKSVAVICIDPSSPFHSGAILGDRIRMNEWYNNPNVYIRSLASRGHLGGLNSKIIEISDIFKAAGFDYIIIETIGVGQNEVEIAGLADVTVVVLVPEAGDDIQVMKSGLMEIADIFVLNKADRPDASRFTHELLTMLEKNQNDKIIPVLKTIAKDNIGINVLSETITGKLSAASARKKDWLIAEKAYQLIAKRRTADINKSVLLERIKAAGEDFNLYRFIEQY